MFWDAGLALAMIHGWAQQVKRSNGDSPHILTRWIAACFFPKQFTLPETNIAPEHGWLEYFLVSFCGV